MNENPEKNNVVKLSDYRKKPEMTQAQIDVRALELRKRFPGVHVGFGMDAPLSTQDAAQFLAIAESSLNVLSPDQIGLVGKHHVGAVAALQDGHPTVYIGYMGQTGWISTENPIRLKDVDSGILAYAWVLEAQLLEKASR